MDAQTSWPHDSVCLRPSKLDVTTLATDLYNRTCRTDFDSPGFCVLNVGTAIESVSFRQLMVDLKLAMAEIHESRSRASLVYLSAARFDQQETTRPHLDGGPEQCFLMLGYEPSSVDAELAIFDYSKCAFDLGLSPQDFMAKHNPMFQAGYDLLRPYEVRIPCFSKTDFQIICINNSSAPYSVEQPKWQGTLHTATILTPDESKRRVVNSTMIASVPLGKPEAISASHQENFIRTSTVRRKGYDKPHLDDD